MFTTPIKQDERKYSRSICAKSVYTTLRCSVGAAIWSILIMGEIIHGTIYIDFEVWKKTNFAISGILCSKIDAVASLPSWITFTRCSDTRLFLIARSTYIDIKLGSTISQSPLAVADWILQRISTIQIACWISMDFSVFDAGNWCKITRNEASTIHHVHTFTLVIGKKIIGKKYSWHILAYSCLSGETKVSFQEELAAAWSSAVGFLKKQAVVVPPMAVVGLFQHCLRFKKLYGPVWEHGVT